MKLSLLLMAVATVVIATGLRWREERGGEARPRGFVAGKAGPNYPAPVEAIKTIQKAANMGRDKALEYLKNLQANNFGPSSSTGKLGPKVSKGELAVANSDVQMAALAVIAGRQQQGGFRAAAEVPAAEAKGTEQGAAEGQYMTPAHAQSPSLALKPIWMFRAFASSPSWMRCTALRLS